VGPCARTDGGWKAGGALEQPPHNGGDLDASSQENASAFLHFMFPIHYYQYNKLSTKQTKKITTIITFN
jgi:hypothetical protein